MFVIPANAGIQTGRAVVKICGAGRVSEPEASVIDVVERTVERSLMKPSIPRLAASAAALLLALSPPSHSGRPAIICF